MRKVAGAAFALLLAVPAARADFNIAVVAGSTLVNNAGAPSFTPTGNDSQIGVDLITAQLNGNTPVTLNTNAGGSQSGTISITVPLTATSSTLTLLATDSITLGSSIDGAFTLNTTAGTATNINGPIGLGTPLTAVSTAGGPANLAGPIIRTTGTITINQAINLLGGIGFTSTGGGDISLQSSVTGVPFGLGINTTGTGLLAGPVSVASLLTDPGGATEIGADVTATGSIGFNDAVQIAATSTIASTGGGNIGFLSTVDSATAPAGLTVSTSGLTLFQGAIGSLNPLASFATDSSGTSQFIQAPITVTGDIALNDPASLASLPSPETITSTGGGNVTFASLSDGAASMTALVVNTSGVTTFNGPIDPLAPFDSITTDAPGSTHLNGGGINGGNIAFNDPVTLGAATTIFSLSGNFTFGSTVDGAFSLNMITSGTVTFNGTVGGITPLDSLTVNGTLGPMLLNSAGITASHDILLKKSVVLGSSATVTSLAAGAIGVLADVNGAFNLALNTSGLTQFSGNIGNSTPLASLSTDAPGTMQMFSTIVSTTGPMFFLDPATISNPATLTSAGSTVNFGSTLSLGGDLTGIGNSINFNGGPASVTGAVALTFAPPSNSAPFTVGGGSALLTSTSLAALANGFASITFGGATGANAETITATTWQDPVIFRVPAAGGVINVTGDITRVDNSTFAFNAPSVGFAAQVLPGTSTPSFVTSTVSPVGTPASGPAPHYFSLDATSGVTTSALTLTLCPAPPNPSAFFWNGSQWVLVSSTLVGGCPVVTLNGASTPPLAATSSPLVFAAAEDLPQVTLAMIGSPIAENGGTATITAILSHAFSLDVTVNLGFSGTASPSDFTAPAVIVIPAGSTSASIALTAVDDAIDEPDETVIVDIIGVTNGVELGTQQVTVTILDDDPPPQLSIGNVAVTEGSVATFTVQLVGATANTVTVNYSTSDGTATAPADYTAASGTLTFTPGQTSQTINVTTATDAISEPNETFTVTLTGPSNATIAVPSATGTIIDASAPPQLSISNASAAEGSPVVFTVQLVGATTQTVTVNYATSNGTATAPADYTATSGTLTFAPGQTSMTVPVPTAADLISEPNETFAITLSSPTNAAIAVPSATGTIIDASAPPQLSISNASAAEGSPVVFTVQLAGATTQTVTVNYATSNGTATAPADYSATSGTLTFAPGQTSMTVPVPTAADLISEPNETFTVTLSGPTNATIAVSSATGTIIDASAPPQLSIANASAAEGSPVVFTVQLAGATTQTVTVNYASSNGTATSPADYAAASGTLTFAPGQTSQTISVATVADGIHELTETFTMTLSGPANATIAAASATGTIIDNDPLPSLSANDAIVAPGTIALVTVTMTGGTSQPVTVDFTTVNGTATAPSSYAAASGTLTFAPGQTSQTISISTNPRLSGLKFTVHLSNPVGATIARADATVTGAGDIPALSPIWLALLAFALAIAALLLIRD